MTIELRIKQIRKDLGLTQTDLGNIASVSKQAVSSWERGVSEPERDAVLKIQQKLHINPNWILGTSNQKLLNPGKVNEEPAEYKSHPSSKTMQAAKLLSKLPNREQDELINYIKTRCQIIHANQLSDQLAANFIAESSDQKNQTK